MMTHAMNCDAFDERLAGYLEGELVTAERRAVEAHLASCLRCTALVRDLDRIRADASVLPELAPSRDLWDGIAERIEAPVIPFAASAAPRAIAVPNRGSAFGRLRLAAVAAALVAVTAGVTYMLTISGSRRDTNPGQTATIGELARNAAADSSATPATPAPSTSANVVTAGNETSVDAVQPAGPTTQVVRNAPATVTSSREIDRLRSIFMRNRSQLDPRTAAIIEANLKVIDEAIAQSKAALSQDPASRFLNDQLNSALDKKLELLRTAALLPQRT